MELIPNVGRVRERHQLLVGTEWRLANVTRIQARGSMEDQALGNHGQGRKSGLGRCGGGSSSLFGSPLLSHLCHGCSDPSKLCCNVSWKVGAIGTAGGVLMLVLLHRLA